MDEKFGLSSTKRLWLSTNGPIGPTRSHFKKTCRIVVNQSVGRQPPEPVASTLIEALVEATPSWGCLLDLAPHALRARERAGGFGRLRRDDRIELCDRRAGLLEGAQLPRHVEASDRLGQRRPVHRAIARQ